jgi:GAF domain-containing protein
MKTNQNQSLELTEALQLVEQRNAELAVINSVQEGLVAEMDMQGIYDLVGEKIRNLFDSQVTIIAIFNHESKKENFKYLYEKGERVYPNARPYDKIRQLLINTRKLIDIEENLAEAYTTITGETPKAVPGTSFPKSLVFVPLIIGKDVRGYVSLQNIDKENAFSESDVRLLNTLANSMSVALENARLFSETEQRNAELAVINSVQEGLVAEMDMQGIYDLVGEKIRSLFDSQVTAIAIFNHETKTEYFHYASENGERVYPKIRAYDKIRERIIQTQTLFDIEENSRQIFAEINGEAPKPVPGTMFAKSLVFVPLIIGNEVRGYVSLQNNDREHAFSESDVRLLSTLANSMSVALENARLFNEAEQRNAELAVINSVQQGLVAEMDMQGIYDLVGEKIKDLFDSQVTVIASFDHENHTEIFNYVFEDGKRFHPNVRVFDQIREAFIQSREPVYIRENAVDEAKKYGITLEAAPGTKIPKSMLYVPLLVGDTVRGYVSLQNLDHEHAFSDPDVRLLTTLANSMSVAIENARLYNEAEQRNAELAVINGVQQGLVAEMDMQGIYNLVGERIRDLFDAQVTGIYSFDHDTKMEHFHYLFEDGERLYPEPRPLNPLRNWIINNKELLLVNEQVQEKIFQLTGEQNVAIPGTRLPQSMLFVPLISGSEVKGCVSLQNLDKEHAFNESDVRLLSTLANSMTVALENARLFNETTRLLNETEQRNAELAVINSVQEGLVREMDMESIYNLVGTIVCKVLNTQTLIIRTFDLERKMETWEYAIENGERLYIDPRPFIWANKHMIETKESILINENYIEKAKEYGDTESGVSKGLPPKSAIFVPMIVAGEVRGSISLQNVVEENAFSDSDVRLLNTLTNSMSVALENARLFNETTRLLAETEQRATEMQTVNKISRALVSQLEFDALMHLVGEQMRETFQADIVYLAIHDIKSNMLNFPYYYGDPAESRPFGNGITEKIILSREPLLINKNLNEVYDKLKAEKSGKMVESYLGVPIISENISVGVISVQSMEQENRFSDNDLRLLTTIAANVGIAMQNAEAYQKLQVALNDLKATQNQLIQSEKMASLGELTAGIAHEIQNPLNFVNNFSELNKELLDELKTELIIGNGPSAIEIANNIQENEEKINHHGKRADAIVKGMLQHSRKSENKKEPTDINALCDEYLRLSYHGLRAKNKSFNATLNTDFDNSIGKINIIPQDIGRVVLNLFTNAFYAVNEKLKAHNSMLTDIYEPTVSISTRKIGDKIEIKVSDNGSGIPQNIVDKIFQPFFTTKPTGQGTGLGLSLSYDIIKAHDGEIKVETKQGEGTTFIIQLQG